MEEYADYNLPLINLLPQFMLGLIIFSFFELAWVRLRQCQARLGEYGMTFKAMGFNVLIGIGVALLLGPVSKIPPYGVPAWRRSMPGYHPWLCLYGLFIYEMTHWLQHWLAHKVRLLWCLHSPHHAPESMHLWIGFNHSFLETIFYMAFTLGFISAILGVDPAVIAVLAFIDAAWSNLPHLSDKTLTSRVGIIERFLQTPSYHRVQYGITRPVVTASFWDVHFGEFLLLGRDLKSARSLRDVPGYLFSPPGWQP